MKALQHKLFTIAQSMFLILLFQNLNTSKVNSSPKVAQLVSDTVQSRILFSLRIAKFFIWQPSVPHSVDPPPNSKRLSHTFLSNSLFLCSGRLNKKKIKVMHSIAIRMEQRKFINQADSESSAVRKLRNEYNTTYFPGMMSYVKNVAEWCRRCYGTRVMYQIKKQHLFDLPYSREKPILHTFA